jgi:threonine/homoserine/homoserine lactone efflux protein
VLTLRHLPFWIYYLYLALYNVFYMLDDSIMLIIAIVTLGHHKLQQNEGRWLKLVSGAVMLGLGMVLLLRPAWLGE